MALNSPFFVFAFLPLAAGVFRILASRAGHAAARAWLLCVSAAFYALADGAHLPLLLASIAFNHVVGRSLAQRPRASLLSFALLVDLGLLAFYKYAGALGPRLGWEGGVPMPPLGISFFTFQQAVFLVEAYLGRRREHGIAEYGLFVLFFPQIVAGPIPRQEETLAQLREAGGRSDARDLSLGLTLFFLGLFKKAVLGDALGAYVGPVFDAAAAPVGFLEGWGAALAYSFQIYFDFSGYSDMAVGAARLFGVRLPLNFDSPYQATDIVDFWRRWHMTLTRILRDFVFMPLSLALRDRPSIGFLAALVCTFAVSGLWHGTGWNFLLWGLLHASFVLCFIAGRMLRGMPVPARHAPSVVGRVCARGLTFLAVTLAWVFFRAPDIGRAWEVLAGMAGVHGVLLPDRWASLLGPLGRLLPRVGIGFGPPGAFIGVPELAWLGAAAVVVFAAPNTQQLLKIVGGKRSEGEWKPGWTWLAFACAVAVAAVAHLGVSVNRFLYARF